MIGFVGIERGACFVAFLWDEKKVSLYLFKASRVSRCGNLWGISLDGKLCHVFSACFFHLC